jgi:hypothetical protein
MTMNWKPYVGLALVFCSAAPTLAAQARRDSAGIRITENAEPQWATGREWRFSEQPLLAIGSGTGANGELGRIVGATRLSDGRIVVADQSKLQLKFYDATGRHLQSVDVGGRREGSFGDFHTIARLPGDSIAVETPGMTLIFAPIGTFVRSVRFGPFATGVIQTPFVSVLGRFDNGTAVVADYPQGQHAPAGARRWVDSASLFLTGPGGNMPRPLGKAPFVVFAAGAEHPSPMNLGPHAVHAASGREFYWGFPQQYEIRVYNSDWKPERIIRRSWTPRPLSALDIDAYVDGWMQLFSKKTGAERDAERNAMRDKVYYPEFLPAFSAILVSGAEELWVREPDLTGAPGCWCLAGLPTVPSKWSVFDASGRWLGYVAMPARFIPFEIGSDYVLGRSRNVDNVAHVVMYRLHKPQ